MRLHQGQVLLCVRIQSERWPEAIPVSFVVGVIAVRDMQREAVYMQSTGVYVQHESQKRVSATYVIFVCLFVCLFVCICDAKQRER